MTRPTTKKLTRAKFLAELAELSEGLRQQVEAGVAGFAIDPAASAARRLETTASFEAFCQVYLPHYFCKPKSLTHEYLFRRLPEIIDNGIGDRDAIAAPRGEAKSTICVLALSLWVTVTGRKHYPLIIMDSYEMAAEALEGIKVELEFNPRLLMDYPAACGRGLVWRAGIILAANNVKLQCFGAGKRMRGLRHGPHRPDLALCDDLENDELVRRAEQRDKRENWLDRTVLSLGPADDSMDVIYIGSVLHYDSVLARKLKHRAWRGKVFRAIIEWPHRMDLWDRWEEIWRNDGDALAMQFYQQNQPDMETGAVVSWPGYRTLLVLMIKRVRDGHTAFDSEQQNDPLSDDNAPFAKCIRFWVQVDPGWQYYGACDPSMGRRDPSALIVAGWHRTKRLLNVVEASIRRRLPDRIIQDNLALQRKYHCLAWFWESIAFQEFARTQLLAAAVEAGVNMPALPVVPTATKEIRIETLQPYFVNGQILLHPSLGTLIEQLRHWPLADHDDGPDCLHMLFASVSSRSYGKGDKAQTAGKGDRHDAGQGRQRGAY